MLKSLILPALVAGLLAATSPAGASAKGAPQTHVVYSGQRLASIAKRYNVTVEALCYANGIRERDPIKPGQRLVIPERSDKDGSAARAAREAAEKPASAAGGKTLRASLDRTPPGRRRAGPVWQEYARKPKRKSYVEIQSHSAKWRGLVIDTKGSVRPSAKQAIANILGATGDHPGVPERLLRLMVDVSDTFGGRPLHIVSGYRTSSYFRDSRHKTSQAIDFAVVGVPNAAVRDYLLTRQNVGVGYYPNSSFLHLDVRPRSTYWVDYAGPGEAPRKTPRGRGAPPTLIDFDDIAEEEAEARASSTPSPSPSAPAAPTATASFPSAADSGTATTQAAAPAAGAARDSAAAPGAAASDTETSLGARAAESVPPPSKLAPRAGTSARP